MAIPTKDSLLVQWAANADAKLTASPTTWGYTAPLATAFNVVAQAYITAYDAMMVARENGTRSEAFTATKNDARDAFLAVARPLYAAVQWSGTISDANKILLGVEVRSAPTPQPTPAVEPGLYIENVDGTVLTARLFDKTDPTRKGRPPGTAGASIFSYVGPVAPTDPTDFKFEGNTGRTKVIISLPTSLTPGTKVYLTAFWFNNRKASSPACSPVEATINYASSLPMAA